MSLYNDDHPLVSATKYYCRWILLLHCIAPRGLCTPRGAILSPRRVFLLFPRGNDDRRACGSLRYCRVLHFKPYAYGLATLFSILFLWVATLQEGFEGAGTLGLRRWTSPWRRQLRGRRIRRETAWKGAREGRFVVAIAVYTDDACSAVHRPWDGNLML